MTAENPKIETNEVEVVEPTLTTDPNAAVRARYDVLMTTGEADLADIEYAQNRMNDIAMRHKEGSAQYEAALALAGHFASDAAKLRLSLAKWKTDRPA